MRSANHQHERQSFFKYMPLDTAKIVLENTTLRWSSPVIFNDPFDVPRELFHEATEHQIAQAISQKLHSELMNPRDNLDGVNAYLAELIQHVKKMYPKGIPATLDSLFKTMTLNPPIGDDAPLVLQQFKEHWRKTLADRRILCLSESPSILSMWNHYADGYKGVVLEFACLDALDSAWLLAKPIEYTNEKLLTDSCEGMADLLLREESVVGKYLANEVIYIKTKEWEYEREWRVAFSKRDGEEGLYSDYKFHQLELKSIILGHQFDNSELPDIVALSQKYPNATINRAKLTAHRELVLEALS